MLEDRVRELHEIVSSHGRDISLVAAEQRRDKQVGSHRGPGALTIAKAPAATDVPDLVALDAQPSPVTLPAPVSPAPALENNSLATPPGQIVPCADTLQELLQHAAP